MAPPPMLTIERMCRRSRVSREAAACLLPRYRPGMINDTILSPPLTLELALMLALAHATNASPCSRPDSGAAGAAMEKKHNRSKMLTATSNKNHQETSTRSTTLGNAWQRLHNVGPSNPTRWRKPTRAGPVSGGFSLLFVRWRVFRRRCCCRPPHCIAPLRCSTKPTFCSSDPLLCALQKRANLTLVSLSYFLSWPSFAGWLWLLLISLVHGFHTWYGAVPTMLCTQRSPPSPSLSPSLSLAL
jgi:hypothetical protein